MLRYFMKNYWAKLHKRSKVKIIFGCIVLLFGAFFGTKLYIKRPRDLGPELEYVGKSTYGCYVPYFCWTRPGGVYYFATDMTAEDLKGYFKKAAYVDNYVAGGGGGGSAIPSRLFISVP